MIISRHCAEVGVSDFKIYILGSTLTEALPKLKHYSTPLKSSSKI